MDKHLTEVLPDPAMGSNTSSAAGEAEEDPRKAPPQMPDTGVPEVEKPDIHEVPEREQPGVEKTDIEEVPDTEPIEIPDTAVKEIPDQPA